jgi:hypothetical protein
VGAIHGAPRTDAGAAGGGASRWRAAVVPAGSGCALAYEAPHWPAAGFTLGNFGAISVLPLAEVNAMAFIVPLPVAVFTVGLLREHASRDRWMAIAAGVTGMLSIARKGGAMLS